MPVGVSARRAASLAVAAVAALSVAACGGGGGNGTPDGTATTGNGRGAAMTAYVDCLRKNGVTVTLPSGRPRIRPSGQPYPSGTPRPRPSGSGGFGRFPGGGFPGGFFGKPPGVDDATWQKAQSACASLRPSFGPGNGNRFGASQAYVNCLRDHGVTPGPGMKTTDPKTVKAMAICKILRPSASPSPTA